MIRPAVLGGGEGELATQKNLVQILKSLPAFPHKTFPQDNKDKEDENEENDDNDDDDDNMTT